MTAGASAPTVEIVAGKAIRSATIVAGWDGTESGRDALELAASLAHLTGASVTAATVAPGDAQTGARETLIDVQLPPGVELTRRAVSSTSTAGGLRDLAAELSAGMVVVGSTHRGAVGRILLGTTADKLLEDASCAVAVAPRGYARRYGNRLQRVVAAFNTTPESEQAVRVACALAGSAHGSLEVLAVCEPPVPPVGPDAAYAYQSVLDTKKERIGEAADRVVRSLPAGSNCRARVVTRGDAAGTLADETSRGVDLLVMGSRGLGRLGRALLDGVPSRVVRDATCPVLIVPRP